MFLTAKLVSGLGYIYCAIYAIVGGGGGVFVHRGKIYKRMQGKKGEKRENVIINEGKHLKIAPSWVINCKEKLKMLTGEGKKGEENELKAE